MRRRHTTTLALLALLGCASPPADEPHESTEVTLWMNPTYDGARVCVEGGCEGIDGDGDTLVLRPGIVGSTFQVHVALDGEEVLLRPSVAMDLEMMGLDPESARIDAMTLLLLRSSESDGTCTLGWTNLDAEGVVSFGEYPRALSDVPCGPFAAE